MKSAEFQAGNSEVAHHFILFEDTSGVLKQSLKTSDAKLARKRVAELNTKFTDIVQEAESYAAENDTPSESRQIGVAVPRYHRARLLGQRPVAELATRYLREASEKLRPGSFKSVRFALELLVSHAGEAQMRDLSQALGREVGFLQIACQMQCQRYVARK